jgi:uncharacterized repeat protein (TIGR03803 family)
MLLSRGLLAQDSRLARTVIILIALALGGCAGSVNNSSSGGGTTGQTYTLSATLSGLTSSGLVLMVNGTTVNVAPSAKTLQLATSLPSGTSYSVTVKTQPTGETCSVAGGSGTISSANVANVVVTCSDRAYSIGGSISGLNGSGLVLANGSDTFTANAGATTFTMPTPVAYTSGYAVTVQTQPTGEACSVGNGTGTMPAGPVTNIAVTCTDQSFSLGGTIMGLGNNAGLALTNGTDTLNVTAGSVVFTMPTPVAYGSSYSVAVQSSPPGLTCTASNASGTMPANNVTTVFIACSDQSYTLGGTISGLTSTGLVLRNGTDALPVASGSTSFQMDMSVAYTSPYSVTVQTQPTGETCTVSNGTGTMPASNITNVVITCSANSYTVGGTISGLSASGLVLLNNGVDATTISANATQFTMNTGVAYGSPYAITVQTQPTGLICSVTLNASGTVGAADVTTVAVTCANTAVLYSFANATSNGAEPFTGVVQGSDGNFYGTTPYGGAYGQGTVFKVTPGGAETVLYSFAGGSGDGGFPQGGVIQASDGNFYGTTQYGGPNGYGTVFKVTPSGTETVLHFFAGGNDGFYPYAGLLQGSDGNLYGTTWTGGANSAGTVLKVTPGGAETVLYSFGASSSDGQLPHAGLIQGSDGNFYGTTQVGGTYAYGTVFMLTPSGSETVLYSFSSGGSDGAQPFGGVIQGSDGNFYGSTGEGGPNNAGTVFRLTPSGTETVLHFFAAGNSDGAGPAGLIQASDGNFYGMTQSGGPNNYGTVFEVTPNGTETVLHLFAGGSSDGMNPAWPSLIQGSDGNLYGTTQGGGTNDNGTVIEIALP